MVTGKKMRGVGYIGYGPERKWRSLVFPNGENRSNPRAKVVTPKTKKVRPLPTSAKARQELIAKMLTLFFSDGHALYNQSVREKFLWKREGFVPIRFLLGFKTISQLAATTAEIVNACKCSCSSELELSIDESSIRRLEPFTKERLEDNIQRAIVLFHLPMKNLKYTITTKAIQEAFECYGPISYVKLRFRPPNETDKPYLRNLRSIPGETSNPSTRGEWCIFTLRTSSILLYIFLKTMFRRCLPCGVQNPRRL
jgi:hypothetical protein